MSTTQPQQQPEQQSQPQPEQQQQPVLVYPNTFTKQPPNSHHSDGSFGTVFIVLAVIVVISAIACYLGRLCNRRAHNSKPKQKGGNSSDRGEVVGNGNNNNQNGKNNNRHKFPKGSDGKAGDLEFGFDTKSKPNGFRSDSRGHGQGTNGFRPESRGNGHNGNGHNGNGGGGGGGGGGEGPVASS